jgi:uncharacterized Zn finger protein
MAREFLLSCMVCSSGVYQLKVNEHDEKVTIVCAVCGHVLGTIEKANDPGTDECEGYHSVNIEGVNF